MRTVTVTLADMVDRALLELESATEVGSTVVLGTDLDAGSTEFELSSGSLVVSDVVQFADELVQVTAVSDDPSPIYTVARGFYTSDAVAHSTNAVGTRNPQYPRVRVKEACRRSIMRLEAMGVALVKSTTGSREAGEQIFELPSDVVEVLQVLYSQPTTGYLLPLDQWRHFPTTSYSTTGQALRLPNYLLDTDEIEVVYRAAYTWDPALTASAPAIELPAVAEDLPSIYAVAWMLSGREISRTQIDRSQEWSETEPARGGVSNALLRIKWQDFYRSLDEALRALQSEKPRHRPYVPMPRIKLS